LIKSIDWENYNTDINCEFGNPINAGKKSIHDTLYEILLMNDNLDIILYDHGTGEIADFITIKENLEIVNISFYHIKSMKGGNYNNSVDDIYEVCQQGIKSLVWLKSKLFLLNKIKKRRQSDKCKTIKGTDRDINNILKKNKLLSTEIIIVQPAIKRSVKISDKFQEVLASANMYIKNSGLNTDFYVWGS